jgi:TonB family protein
MRRAGLVCLRLSLLMALAATPAYGQDASQASANEQMLDAAKVNGLAGADVQPWHLKASFKVLYKQGNVSDEGTYEEFWVSGNKYKRIYASNVFSEAEYGSEKLPLRTGSGVAAPYPLGRLRNLIVHPFPDERTIDYRGVDIGKWEVDGATLECPELRAWRMGDIGAAPDAFCLDASNTLIASIAGPEGQSRVSYKNPIAFQGRKVAGDVEVTDRGVVTLSVHVDSLEPLAPVDDSIFQPPADAVPAEIKMIPRKAAPTGPEGANLEGSSISAGVAQGLLLTKVAPVYPPIARAARVQGTVVLQAIISKEGRVTEIHVIDGPPLLLQAAIDAVQQWTYRPYMLNDEPVEVRTTVNVLFQLGQPAKAE